MYVKIADAPRPEHLSKDQNRWSKARCTSCGKEKIVRNTALRNQIRRPIACCEKTTVMSRSKYDYIPLTVGELTLPARQWAEQLVKEVEPKARAYKVRNTYQAIIYRLRIRKERNYTDEQVVYGLYASDDEIPPRFNSAEEVAVYSAREILNRAKEQLHTMIDGFMANTLEAYVIEVQQNWLKAMVGKIDSDIIKQVIQKQEEEIKEKPLVNPFEGIEDEEIAPNYTRDERIEMNIATEQDYKDKADEDLNKLAKKIAKGIFHILFTRFEMPENDYERLKRDWKEFWNDHLGLPEPDYKIMHPLLNMRDNPHEIFDTLQGDELRDAVTKWAEDRNPQYI